MRSNVVCRLPKKAIQLGMGISLLIAIGLIVSKLRGWIPSGGTSLGLTGMSLILGIVGNFFFWRFDDNWCRSLRTDYDHG